MSERVTPEGFQRHFRTSSLTDPWEPIYSRVDDRGVTLGLHLRESHCNSRGLVHGGLIAALADNAMELSVVAKAREAGRDNVLSAVTVSLSTDYVGSAKLSEWMQIDCQVIKIGGRLGFAQSIVTADGETISRANATFKLLTG